MSGPDRARRSGQGAAGFTLVEVLVALTLLAVVVAMIGASSRMFTHARAGLGAHAGRIEEALLARGTLRDRLERAPPLNVGRAGSFVVAFEGDAEHARFATLRPDYEPGPPVLVTEIAVTDLDGGGRALVLRTGAAAIEAGDWDLPDEVEERIVMKAASDLELAYLRPAEDASGAPRWESRWRNEQRPPVALRVLQEDMGSAPLIVPLRLTTPPLCAAESEEPAAGCEAG